jgi:hypothetical protein
MEKVPNSVLQMIEVNKRYIEQQLDNIDNLLDEISYEENKKELNEERLKDLKEEYERELRDFIERKNILKEIKKQTQDFISK